MKVSTEQLLKEVQAMVSASHQIKHPLSALLFSGKLTKRQLQEVIGQQSCIPLYNHKFHGNLYVVCPDHRWRARIAEIVYEEGSGKLFAGGVSHHELYLRLGEALDIRREQLWSWPLCAEALAFRVHYEAVCARSGSDASGPGTSPMGIEPSEVLRSPLAGIWHPAVARMQSVAAGALVGRVTDPFGRLLHEARAPFAGEILYVVVTPPVSQGEPLAGIGRLASERGARAPRRSVR